jgi:hypothetical protein
MEAINSTTHIKIDLADVTRAVRLGNHPLVLVTFASTGMRDAILSSWYNICNHDDNKFGVREDLTKSQQRHMAYMRPVYNWLRSGDGRTPGARGPFFKRGLLYYHETGNSEPLLHPANHDPTQVPPSLQADMQQHREQVWSGCNLRCPLGTTTRGQPQQGPQQQRRG